MKFNKSEGDVGTLLITNFLPSVDPIPIETNDLTETTSDNGLSVFDTGISEYVNDRKLGDGGNNVPSGFSSIFAFRLLKLGEFLGVFCTCGFHDWYPLAETPAPFGWTVVVRFLRGGVLLPSLLSLLFAMLVEHTRT